jgi:pectinesterase
MGLILVSLVLCVGQLQLKTTCGGLSADQLMATGLSTSRSRSVAVIVENGLAIARENETIELQWPVVVQHLPSASPLRVRVIDDERREVTSQIIDSDANGIPELLIFQASFGPNQKKQFFLEDVAPAVKPVSRVHVMHDAPRDDVAWESDRIAFRIYGEGLKKTPDAMSSSGIDVWVKSVRTPVVEKWYAKSHEGGSYHVDTGEGADFFDVGQTLGAGGTAIWRGDSLYRADNFKSYRLTADGPIRASFELRYDPWSAGDPTVSEVKKFSIDAGQNLYRQESIFTSNGPGEITYAIGLVKRQGMRGTESKDQSWGWLSGWGPFAPKNGGHGELGTAVLLPRERITDWKETPTHYLAISHATSGQPVVHYIGAGWTASGDFPTPQSWWSYLDQYSMRLASPVKVTFGCAHCPQRAR